MIEIGLFLSMFLCGAFTVAWLLVEHPWVGWPAFAGLLLFIYWLLF